MDKVAKFSGGSEPQPNSEIVRFLTARNPQEAHLWCQALTGAGIRSQVVGECLGSFGVVPPGHPIPEIWVRREDVVRARQILERLTRTTAGPMPANHV
jgi:hypothetical protein